MSTVKFYWEVVLVGLIFVRETVADMLVRVGRWIDRHFVGVRVVIAGVVFLVVFLTVGTMEFHAL